MGAGGDGGGGATSAADAGDRIEPAQEPVIGESGENYIPVRQLVVVHGASLMFFVTLCVWFL